MAEVTVSEPIAADTARWAAELGAEAFAMMSHRELGKLVPPAEFERFRRLWDDLELDPVLPGGGQYRLRRYGRLLAEAKAGSYRFTALPHVPFRQDAEHIPDYGGRPRTFAPIPDETLLSPALTSLVAVDLALATTLTPADRWIVGLHMIRVVAKAGAPGQATPEGRHRDGHDYVGMHLIDRRDCEGGHSVIYREGRPTVRHTLATALDSLIVDDDALTHEVTATVSAGPDAVRDTLLVDLNVD
ncbi:2OG-Fe dioxygenase family protein [Nonomuraea fuscirosea]|uniref:2-oxoglutarate-Fe(II)-dependent dioxygenase family protein n=1 Tax=Nonomuraea fuscirosea TaxID=1291556 RepID=A0A2T0MQG0_9ACTN|nr:2OG-Fe dioxygenase family protein [Nonomuraea fuscirosea]PRX60355.1 hypothetical protein B0I32_117122 [Nonomuraea fuscirosea]